MAQYIHWLCGKCGLERPSRWYEQKSERVVESENFEILWECDWKIEERRPDIGFTDNTETEVVIPGEDRVEDKELEKVEKYKLLKDEIAKVWQMGKVVRTIVPVVIGALGAVSGQSI